MRQILEAVLGSALLIGVGAGLALLWELAVR